MADPEHRPHLDSFDESTVRLYRSGLAIVAASVLMVGIVLVGAAGANVENEHVVRGWVHLGWVGLVYGTGAAVSNLHIYDKRIRAALHGSAWFGTVVVLIGLLISRADLAWWVIQVGVGFVFITVSGLALKEQYCFKLPLMRLVPALLAIGVVATALDVRMVAGLALLAAGILLFVMAIAKGRMPLHYDVGDKSRYQV